MKGEDEKIPRGVATMKIVTVFRPGGDYSIKHVQWLHKQLPKQFEALCFSDIAIPGIETIPFN